MTKYFKRLFKPSNSARFVDYPSEENTQVIGWVNVYKRSDGKIIMSQLPKVSRRQAMRSKSRTPLSEYMGCAKVTIEIE